MKIFSCEWTTCSEPAKFFFFSTRAYFFLQSYPAALLYCAIVPSLSLLAPIMLGLNVVLLLSLLPSLTLGSTLPSVGSRASDSSPEAEYPVSVERANDSAKGFGFSHAWNIEYTATVYINGVAYQVCPSRITAPIYGEYVAYTSSSASADASGDWELRYMDRS